MAACVLARVLRVARVLVLGASRRSYLFVCCVMRVCVCFCVPLDLYVCFCVMRVCCVCVDTCCVLGSPQLLATPGHHQCVYL